MHRRGAAALLAASATWGALPCATAAAVFDDPFEFQIAAGPLHTESFETAPLVGSTTGGSVVMLPFDGLRAVSEPAALRLVNVAYAGNHGTTPFGSRYLVADSGSLAIIPRVRLQFEPPIDRLGFFVIDLDFFDLTVTIDGVAYTVPSTGNGGTAFFGIVAGAAISEVVLRPAGGDPSYSLDDISFPAPPAPMPAGAVPAQGGVRASMLPGGDLLLSWEDSCAQDDTDFEIYEGILGDFRSHRPLLCSTGGATSIAIPPPAFDAYYLVVARNLTREGSYGVDRAGASRPRPAAACLLQQLTCP
jgi:hypothetical protein